MSKVDVAEKVCRTVLWAVLAFVAVSMPIMHAARERADREAAEKLALDLKKTQTEAKEALKPARLPLKGLGTYLAGMHYTSRKGSADLTNVSAWTGHLCAVGVLTNDTGQTSRSLATCSDVNAFSSIHLDFVFVGSEVDTVCPKGEGCNFSLVEADESYKAP